MPAAHTGIGVTALIEGVTTGNDKYATGAQNQLNVLFSAPHDGDIISHRAEAFQAWFVLYALPLSLMFTSP